MSAGARDRLAGMRVLVVEDFAAVRALLRSVLEIEGAMVVEAGSGREAVELAAEQTFDVALTDLGLPDMPGEAVVTRIRSVSQGRTSVAVISGGHTEDLSQALEAGAERVFTKPMDCDDLVRYLIRRAQAAAAPAPPGPGPETTMTVLVVEDDSAMRALLRDVLQRSGYRVIEQSNGAEVPAVAEHEQFDAVILDKEMPGASGLDLLSFLRTRLPAVPVIFVTAFGGPGIAREATRRGAYAYLEKPFRMAVILDTLADVPAPRLGPKPEAPTSG